MGRKWPKNGFWPHLENRGKYSKNGPPPELCLLLIRGHRKKGAEKRPEFMAGNPGFSPVPAPQKPPPRSPKKPSPQLCGNVQECIVLWGDLQWQVFGGRDGAFWGRVRMAIYENPGLLNRGFTISEQAQGIFLVNFR